MSDGTIILNDAAETLQATIGGVTQTIAIRYMRGDLDSRDLSFSLEFQLNRAGRVLAIRDAHNSKRGDDTKAQAPAARARAPFAQSLRERGVIV